MLETLAPTGNFDASGVAVNVKVKVELACRSATLDQIRTCD